MFGATGLLLRGIYSGVTTVSAAAVIAAISATGLAQNLNLASIGAGNISTLPDGGGYVKTTTNEALAAGYAFLGLHTDGAQKIGLRVGAVTTPITTVESRVNDRVLLWSDSGANQAGGAALRILTPTAGAAFLDIDRHDFVFNATYATLYFTARALSTVDNNGEMRIRIYDDSGTPVLLGTGTAVVLASAVYTTFEASIDMTALGLVDGDSFEFVLEAREPDRAHATNIRGGSITAST